MEEAAERVRSHTSLLQLTQEKQQMELSHKRARIELEKEAHSSSRDLQVTDRWDSAENHAFYCRIFFYCPLRPYFKYIPAIWGEKRQGLKQGLKYTADKNPLERDLVHSRLDWPVSAVEKPNLTFVCVCMRLSDYIYRGKLTVTESY